MSAQLTERDGIIESLRERERQMAADLRERDALIESLEEDRDQRDQELDKTRREFNNLLKEKDRDMEKLLVRINWRIFWLESKIFECNKF